jgi:hypothetical protein
MQRIETLRQHAPRVLISQTMCAEVRAQRSIAPSTSATNE